MASLGQLNHVLTNAGTAGSTTLTYTCVSVDANGSLYRVTGDTSPASDILYHPVNGWSDSGSSNPYYFGGEIPVSTTINPAYDADTLIITDNNFTILAVLNTGYPSGPTVTSITVDNEISSTRTFTVTHTGTLTASDISYKINGVDVTSLSSPNTPITNLQTTATGSTFDSYTLSSNGYHLINIGTQYLEFYKSLTTLAQNTFPELTNAGLSISFPSTSALWLAKAPAYDSATLYNDGTQYKGTSQFNGYDRIEYLWIGTKYFSNTDPTLRGFKVYVNTYIDEPPARWLQGNVFYIDPVARYEDTGLLTSYFYAGLTHVSNGGYYSFDFVSLLAQSTTTSNGGGKPDRYPLIMTNLFNRNRSIYSIGMTHKDTWDLFL